MVMGMNGCGPFSLTSRGLINALEQARTLRHSQSDIEIYTPPERRGDGQVLCWEVWVGSVYMSEYLCWRSFFISLLLIYIYIYNPPLNSIMKANLSFNNQVVFQAPGKLTPLVSLVPNSIKVQHVLIIALPGADRIILGFHLSRCMALWVAGQKTSKAPRCVNYSGCYATVSQFETRLRWTRKQVMLRIRAGGEKNKQTWAFTC